jgi:glycosyltransferase involved in cell wall biosynthesis
MTAVRRVLTLIPAHNEAASLRAVVSDLREQRPGADILVVNDGSSDDTASILRELGVRWLHWPERRGVGSALRAGLRYAARQRYDVVVRLRADRSRKRNRKSFSILRHVAASTRGPSSAGVLVRPEAPECGGAPAYWLGFDEVRSPRRHRWWIAAEIPK